MAQYPIDIKIDTGPATSGLSNLDAKLDATAKAATAAAKAADNLTTSTDSVAKAAAEAAQQQVNQLSKTIAVTEAARKTAQAQLDQIEAYKQTATSVDQLNKYNSTQLALQRSVINLSNEQVTATRDLTKAQAQLDAALAPIIKKQQDQKAAQEAAAQAARNAAQAQKEAAQQAAAQAKSIADATRSNNDYINSLKQQVRIAQQSGDAAARLQNQFKLNSAATKEQREEVARLTQALQDLKAKQDDSSAGSNNMVTAFKALLGLAVVQKVMEWSKEFINTADSMRQLQARVSSLADSQQQATSTMNQLITIANKTGNSIEDTAGAYQQLYLSAKQAGVSSNEVVQLVNNLQKAAVISGTSAEGSSRAIYQLSQAFSIGKLQGQDFKAMAQNMPITLKLMADSLGLTVGQLRELATAGELGVDKILKLNDNTDKINKEFDKTPRLVEAAANALQNNLAVAIDVVNQKLGITAGIAAQLDGYAGVVDRVLKLSTGTYTEQDEFNKQLGIQVMLLDKLKAAAKGSDPDSMTGRNYAKEIANQQKVVDGLNNQKKVYDNLSKSANDLSEQVNKASQKPEPAKEDKTATKALKTLQDQAAAAKLSGVEQAQLIAVQKLGDKATQEQIASAKALAASIYNSNQAKKEDLKTTRESESAAKRAQKQLERNQLANEKYIETLKVKTEASGLDLQATKLGIQLQRAESTAGDDQVASIQKLLAAQNAYALAAAQKEAQSKLNKDATDAERASVDALVASQYAQQQQSATATAYSSLSNDLTRAGNTDQQNGMADIGSQEANRYTVLQEARDLDLVNEQEYQDQKSKIQADADKQRTKLTATSTNQNLAAVGQGFTAFGQLAQQFAGDQNKRQKVAFATMKAFAIAASGLQLAQALITALADPSDVIWPVKLAHIAAVAVAGAGMIATISGSNYATGGLVNGPGTGISDSVPANLSRGEFVSTAATTSRYRTTLEAMNNGTYREDSGTGAMPNVSIVNNSSQPVTGTVTSITRDEVSIMIQDQVPDIMAGEAADPYSGFSKSITGEYNLSRNN